MTQHQRVVRSPTPRSPPKLGTIERATSALQGVGFTVTTSIDHTHRRQRLLSKLTPVEFETIMDKAAPFAAQETESTKPQFNVYGAGVISGMRNAEWDLGQLSRQPWQWSQP